MKTRRLVVCSLVVTLVLWSGLGWAQQPQAWWHTAHCPVGRSDFLERQPGSSARLRNLLDLEQYL